MADVQIEAAALTNLYMKASRGGIFWTSPTVGYVIYADANSDLVYRKTADGGANWAAHVDVVAPASCNALYFDCYADWQTDGDAGTKIHIVYISLDTSEVRYVYLDTNGDSVGGDDLIETCQGTGTFYTFTQGRSKTLLSITKTRGGNLAVTGKYWDTDSVKFDFLYTSPDADTWTSKTSPYETDGDYCIIFPANLADNQDIWGAYWDASANEISLKTFDDSNNDWTTIGEASISGSMTESAVYLQMDGAIRLSDGHLIFAAWNLYDNAQADLMTWDITDAGTITAKTNVITDTSEYFLVSVFINQDNDDVYVAYVGGSSAQASVAAQYQLSQDGCGTWDGEVQIQANADDDERWISCGAVKAANGGMFLPVWFNDDLNDLFCNTDNGISIAAAAGAAHEKALSDSVAIADAISKAVGKIRSDSLALADSIGKAPERVIADSVALADALAKTVVLYKADSVDLTDSVSKEPGLTESDSVAITDGLIKAVGLIKSEAVTITDSISKTVGLIKSDSVAISDAIIKTMGLVKSETMAIADTFSRSIGFIRTLSDTVTITDSISVIRGLFITLSDTVTITDSGIVQICVRLRQRVSRMTIVRFGISRMESSRLRISRMPLLKCRTRRF